MLIRAVILSIAVYYSKCSVVIDSLNQKGLYLSEYCPKTEFCEEGTHVMCMYYNPKQLLGPRCSNAQNISMTSDIADKLLEVSNAVRSRIALGKETGKGGPLPRGYGIFRLNVFIIPDATGDYNQSTSLKLKYYLIPLSGNLRRSQITDERFHDPGQATGLVRFTFPDWLPVSNKSHFTTSKLTPPKLNYAITQTMKTWYSQKNHVTPEMIFQYPDFQQNARSQFGKLYLKMIYGPATHMGCGISAYTQFAYYDNNSPLNYNVVQVVCNYSAKPGPGQQVYTTTPPTQVGYTIKCGCPEGYDEDADCLCYENRKQRIDPPTSPNFCSDDSCKQSVVLLPIFTVEDAPQHELLPPSFGNNSLRIGPTDMLNRHRNRVMNTNTIEPQNLNEFTAMLKGSHTERYIYPRQPSVVKRQFEKGKLTNKHHHYSKSNLPVASHVPRRLTAKHSIFSRAKKFQLPTRKVLASYRVGGKEIKKDVAPRKDFSSIQKVLKSYLNKKRNHVGNIFNTDNYEYTSNEPTKLGEFDEPVSINTITKRSEVINPSGGLNTFSKQKFGYEDFNTTKHINELKIIHSNYNNDKKLMTLLDNLEKEVKHIELDSRDKEIFDSKIRKIYGRLVGKQHGFKISTNGDKHNEGIDENLNHYETVADNEFIKKNVFNKKASDNNKLNPYDDTGLIKRNQNSIRTINNNHINGYRDYKFDNNNNNFHTEVVANEDEQLSYDRRKYYQDKLDILQRKLQSMRRNHQSSVNSARHVKPVRPAKTSEMQVMSKGPKHIETVYIPDRARFIHGF